MTDWKTSPITPALIAGIVAVLGWYAVHIFTAMRDRQARGDTANRADRVKRLELLLKQAEDQITEFYGPVHGLVHQIWAAWEIKQQFSEKLDPESMKKFDHFLGERYFADYHEQIRTLI